MTLQELVVDLRLNAENFARGLESAMTTWESFGSSLLKIGAGLSAALTVPIVGIGQAAIKMGTQLQQAEIAFGTMLGSAELAGNYLNELKDFAAKTPFEFSELVPAAKRLMALGFAAEETIPMMKALGNAAAGLGGGAALIQRLGLALGQMRAKAKVSAEEMRQLAEAGIPAWEMLAKAMGKSTAELMKLSEKGQVSAAAAIPILIQGINEKFGGLMEGFMSTAMGQYSNVKDQLGFVLADIGKALLPIAALLIEKFALPAVSALRDLAAWFSKLSDSSKFLIIGFAAVAAAIGPMTVALGAFGYMYAPLISGAARVSSALMGAFGNIVTVLQGGTAAIGALEMGILKFVGIAVPALALVGIAFAAWQIPAVREKLIALWEVMQKFYSDTIAPFVSDLAKIGQAFMETAATAVESGLKTLLEDLNALMKSDSVASFTTSLRDLKDAFGDLFSAVKPLWEALGPLISEMIKWSAFMAAGQISIAVETLTNGLKALTLVTTTWLDALGALATSYTQAATQGVSGLATALDKYLKPAIENQVTWLKVLSDSFAATFPRIAGILGLVGEAYDKFKEKVKVFVEAAMSGNKDAAKATTSALDQMTAAFQAAVVTQKELEKAASTVDAKTGKLGATYQQVAVAANAAQQAEATLRAEMKRQGVDLETLYAAWTKSKQVVGEARMAVEKLTQQQKEGKATNEQVALAREKATLADKAMTAAQIQLQQSGARLGIGLADLNRQYAATAVATVSLIDKEKALKEALKQAEINYKNVARAYDAGTASARQLADAQIKLSIAQNAANPEHLIEWHKKQNEEQLKFNSKLGEMSQKTAQARISWLDFSAALERGEAQKALESLNTTADMLGRNLSKLQIPEALAPKGMHAQTQQMIDDQKLLGTETEKSAAVMQAAYERQVAAGMLTGKKRIEVQRDILLQIQKEEEDAGRKLTDAQQKQLDKLTAQLDAYGKKAETFWTELGDAIQGIMMNWAADIGRGLWESLLGKNRREFNKGLDQQASDLNASLQERTQEWEDYQSDIASRQEAAQAEYENTLAEESASLQEALDERVQDYADAEAETAQKLDEVRAEYAKDLADQLSDLAQSLEERRVEYDDYVQEIADKLAETRQTHAEQLAEQLSDLEDSLNDHRRSYDEYVADVNKKLSLVGEDYAESIDDETKQVKAGVDDKKQQYKRDEDDILEKIARLKKKGKTEQDEEVQDLRKSLRRKTDDLEEYIRESGEKLDEFVSDAKRRNDREVADLAESLQQRTDDWARYQEDNQAKRNEYINKNAQDLAKEEADLAHSLADRTAEWAKYQADNAKKVDKAYAKYTEGLAKEEKSLMDSLAKKSQALDDYIADVNKKWAKIQEAALVKLEQEEADLAASLATRGVEYDRYVSDTQTRLDELVAMHKTAWGDIGDMMVNAFERAGESVATFISTYLMGKLLDSLTKGALWDAVVSFGKRIANIFTGGGGASAAASTIPQLPGAIPGAATTVSGAGGGAASIAAAGSGAAAWVGVAAQAIGTAITALGQAKMEGTLNAIEKEARYAQIHLYYLLERANLYWPKLEDIHWYLWNSQNVRLASIEDSLKSDITTVLGNIYKVLTENLKQDVSDILWFIRDSYENTREALQDVVSTMVSASQATADAILNGSQMVVDQLMDSTGDAGSTTTTGEAGGVPVTGPTSVLGNILDTVAQALAAVKIPRPNLPSMEELTRLLSAQQATQAITAKKIDPFNPLGASLLAERDKLAAEIALLEAANQMVSDEMRKKLKELSESQPVLTQEAYLKNIGSEYQSWLSSMVSRTKGMLEQWAAYNTALQAVANLGQMAGDMSNIVPGMINPLSGTPAGAGTPVNVVVSEFTVNTVIDGRTVGNAVISNLALQGVRI